MNIKIFADGSNIKEIFDLYENNKLVLAKPVVILILSKYPA